MYKSLFSIALMCLVPLIGGCAGAKVDQTLEDKAVLPKPDKVIVHDFALTADEVKLDKGVLATVYRDTQGRTVTEDEMRAGKAVALTLSKKLVEQLNKDGIPAERASSGVQPTKTSLVLEGQFVNVDQGDQTERVWIGFGLGGSKLRTRAQVFQDGKLIAKGETSTNASMTPGMIVGLATGSAGGTLALSAAEGLATAGFSETFMATVEADADRTAKAIAEKIKEHYAKRGWLAK